MKTSRTLAALLGATFICPATCASYARAQESVAVAQTGTGVATRQDAQTTGAQTAQTTNAQVAPDAAARGGNVGKTKRAVGSIKGRVTGEGGEPLAGVSVSVFPRAPGPGPRPPYNATTDDEGNFTVAGIEPGLYTVNAGVPGYVTEADPLTGRSAASYRPGDTATVRLVKGGVITGAVTDAQGAPLVALGVRAYRVRDLDGRATPVSGFYGSPGRTDDRGVYRIYGLQPGFYVVLAGGLWPFSSFGLVSPYQSDAPTFYPSSTRDTALEVTVRAGQETAGVDIRYREEQGHRVTGRLDLPAGLSDPNYATGITLAYASSGLTAGNTYVGPSATNLSFSLDSVADGDYDLQATSSGSNGLISTSAPLRVSVRGADVTGLRLTLAPLASVGGTLVIEPASEADRARDACKGAHTSMPPQETLVNASLDRPASAKAQPLSRTSPVRDATPDDAGAFTLRGLEAGRYRLSARPFDENFYVRSIQLPPAGAPTNAAPASAAQRASAGQRAGGAAPADTRAAATPAAAREPLDLRPGQQLSGVTVRLSEGAAGLSGRVVASEGSPTPPFSSLRVHLLPAEREHTDDALRFFETAPAADGAFSFKNLPPGRYLLLARAAADAAEAAPRPASWDADARARLRREAEAAGTSVELQPCQRATDFALRFPPPAK